MNDIFDETEENLRADQWVAIVKRALPWVGAGLGAALVIALCVMAWNAYQGTVSSKASEAYEAAAEAKIKGDKAGAKAKFEAAENAGNPNYKAMALMELAGMAQDDKNDAEALKDLDAAAKATSDPILSDTAAYKAALIAIDTQSYADVEARLKPLTGDKRPLSGLAKEALALAKLQNGDAKGARSDLQLLSLTLGTPDGVRQRAASDVLAIDSGAAPTAIATLKLPEAQPPAPTLPAGMTPAQAQAMAAAAAQQQQAQ